MGLGTAALFALGWIGLLFAVATLAEAYGERPRGRLRLAQPGLKRLRLGAYTLALGVYCSSWTIYGAVGSVVREGWNFLPIYLAPIALLALAPGFLRRLSATLRETQATTPSDFIAARFGHDVVVARLVTVIALAGSVPYMALQLRSIGTAMAIITGNGDPVVAPTMLGAAGLLALFAILFGARRFERSGRSEGMVYAIALESGIKLLALFVVAALAIGIVMQADGARAEQGLAQLARHFRAEDISLETGVIALISACAILVLPRQFYMALVEARDVDDLPRARWGVVAYVLAMVLLVVPIAWAGIIALGHGVAPDFYVLYLPLASGHGVIAAAALIGGISAAAAMVITDATALAAMVSNDLIFPSLLRGGVGVGAEAGVLGRRMLLVRRASIVGVIALALTWAELVSPRQTLASIGLVAFAAMAQFTPHMILAVFGGNRDGMAARASLGAGLVLWLYTLALPPILPEGWRVWLAAGPLDPLRLLGIGHAPPLVHGVLWSLGVNLAMFVAVSARRGAGNPLPSLMGWQRQVSDLSDLKDLTASFIGHERAEREFADARRGMAIDGRSAQRARKLIAAVVGASSARALVASAMAGGTMSLAAVTRLLDERGQSLTFSRQLLAATFENIEAGISVVDGEQKLVAWNTRYEQLFDYPVGLLYVGAPVADLIRHNARRGDFGAGADVEHEVEKRLRHLGRAQEYTFERYRPDGQVIKMVGGPMPGGGYVTSFIDITAEAQVRAELKRTLAGMESRVAERTHELSEANQRLAQADRDKTRFLAAASHDLLQPLHAARLFTAALARDVPEHSRVLVGRVDNAIIAAEDLLRALLDISKLDAGGVQARPEPLLLAPFLRDLVENFRPMAEQKGLELRLARMSARPMVLRTDPGLLRSLLQNFLTNALRYTLDGGVLVGARWRHEAQGGEQGAAQGEELRIDVIDTGVGIPPQQREAIFGEFTRLGEVEAEGLGLGLALSRRIARLLGARIEVVSQVGRGSRFSLTLPAAQDAVTMSLPSAAPPPGSVAAHARALNVLVLDNDPLTVEATAALLTALGHHPHGAEDGDAARAILRKGPVDAVLADYRLDTDEDGLSVVESLRAEQSGLPAMLITAETNPAIRERALAMGVVMMAKPANVAGIEGFLAGV
ncbi:MAG: hybrid sensor histidine kinase/response regulator [Novosphingobium sp. 63-713]|uniref:hybrid sensor histidine kinase/response regulator n=1 Tax=unclassified Novosphingobium TaxID=2644732 RepID=UPI000966DC3D|nr:MULTISPECIES: PAS domain-containing hybrid sensor histidine kinase/response regulator [unclassified Novosphingobium]MBN9145192.1 PAS-domain containing protein [Novosphingobium sp.]MDR6709569.1 signal transduction histidine kinase/Na+/proline symporter [Novosphingobium sp. 1748]OJX88649.1 MAG: hybrid sensor histidine kinase/response regulator [Novosphingobium sp. 63-713]